MNCVHQSIIIQSRVSFEIVMMALHYVLKSAIFETATFAVAGIIGYLIVYRWFRT
jgi:hypothetical protein